MNEHSWLKVWREGFAPIISMGALNALAEALRTDDARLIQGGTTTPPPLWCVKDWGVEGACALAYCGWIGDELKSVGEVEEYFARMCFECDNRLEEAAACRFFLNWLDETPRYEMRRLLVAAVEEEINKRVD